MTGWFLRKVQVKRKVEAADENEYENKKQQQNRRFFVQCSQHYEYCTMKRYQLQLMVLFTVALLMRFIISIGDYRGDVKNHIAWGKNLYTNGFIGFYEREFPKRYGTANPNYPPFANYVFFASYILYEGVKNLIFWLNMHIGLFPSKLIFIFDNPNLLPTFFKIGAILADFGIAWLVYLFGQKIVKKKNPSLPLILSLLVLFNPAFFYNSAWWGQVESIPIFFTLAAIYSFFFGKNQWLPVIFLSMALLSKQTAIIFIPIFAIMYFKKYGVGSLFLAFMAGFFCFYGFFFPFTQNKLDLVYPLVTYWTKIATVSGLPYITNHAFNLWMLLVGDRKIAPQPYFTAGYLMTGILAASILYKMWRNQLSEETIFYASYLIALSFFLFFPRMHERHLQQALPFLLILGAYQRKYLYSFVFLSFFSFINLYHGWWSPPLPFIEPLLSPFVINLLIAFVIGLFTFQILKLFKEKS